MIKLDEIDNYVDIIPISLPFDFSIPFFLKKMDDIRKNQKLVCLQVIRLTYVAGEFHILSALWHALRAFENQQNIAKSLETEFLLYLSGQRQIKTAIEMMGVKESSDETVLIVVSTKECVPDMKVILSELNVTRNTSISLDIAEEKEELILCKLPVSNSSQSFEDKILQMIALTALQGK